MINYSKTFSDTVWDNIIETDSTYMLQVKKEQCLLRQVMLSLHQVTEHLN